MAALEFIGERYPTISLAVLGGARRFPKVEAVTTLLEAALNRLRVSRHTTGVHFDAVLAEESDGGLRDVLRDIKTAMARPENALSIQP